MLQRESEIPDKSTVSTARRATKHDRACIVQLLGQVQYLVGQFSTVVVFGAHQVVHPKPCQNRECLRRLTYEVGQFSRAREGSPDFRGAITFRVSKRPSQRSLKQQFLLIAPVARRQP